MLHYIELKSGIDQNHAVQAEFAETNSPLNRRGRMLCCGVCGHKVISETDAIDIGGVHFHQRSNPAGYVFYFRCFKDTCGCAMRGNPTDEYSWFVGYRWVYVHCENCGTQLGWYFTSQRHAFFAIVCEQVAPCGQNEVA